MKGKTIRQKHRAAIVRMLYPVEPMQFGPLVLDVPLCELSFDNGKVERLSMSQNIVLTTLLKHVGRPVHRDRLIAILHGPDGGPEYAESVVRTAIWTLRKMLVGCGVGIFVNGFGWRITLDAPKEAMLARMSYALAALPDDEDFALAVSAAKERRAEMRAAA